MYYCNTSERDIDPRAIAFMERARVRYLADSRRDIPKALLLTRPKRGIRGHAEEATYDASATCRGRAAGSRNATQWHIGEKAVLTVAKDYGVTDRTIRSDANKQNNINKARAKGHRATVGRLKVNLPE